MFKKKCLGYIKSDFLMKYHNRLNFCSLNTSQIDRNAMFGILQQLNITLCIELIIGSHVW